MRQRVEELIPVEYTLLVNKTPRVGDYYKLSNFEIKCPLKIIDNDDHI